MSDIPHLSGNELREAFLRFFAGQDHERIPSSPLVPENDPTLLFTNAGMVQFKEVFLGAVQPPSPRATTTQKCMRAGGKHNDLENVGHTARHHTFFEMLGNFSFGDYFKERAIALAWRFLTEELSLPGDRLWATVYQDDDEAAQIWERVASLPPERIVRLGEKGNFWAMGETGPCGPCSEIVFDRGPAHACDHPSCGIGRCDCDRWLELWNLVFMQYERDEEGELRPLERRGIDTGMGLERLASVLQGTDSNFETDLIRPIIKHTEEISGRKYDGQCEGEGMAFRVIADHVRACTFLVADGVFPANEGRGYVLRRILRRAVRFGRLLGFEEPFMHRLVSIVVQIMGDAYPELRQRGDYVSSVLRAEEERFFRTLEQGLSILQDLIGEVQEAGGDRITGEGAFLLYDTYGFPVDLTEDVAREHGLEVDRSGFEDRMAEQRRRAQQAQESGEAEFASEHTAGMLSGVPPTEFRGYDHEETSARVLAILCDGERRPAAAEGEEVSVVLDITPFCAEAGGQVSDQGRLEGVTGRADVLGVTVTADGRYLHRAKVRRGRLEEGGTVRAAIDGARRARVRRNHTATHLLHRALKEELGEHVNQAGSLVAPDRLRFDFTHFEAMSPSELRRVEDAVNREILAAHEVNTYHTDFNDALEEGVIALFGEKYGGRVRVVDVVDYTAELCGGTHVRNTSEVGLFKLVSESSVGSGLRRIEGLTGEGVLDYVRDRESLLEEVSAMLQAAPQDLGARISDLKKTIRRLEQEVQAAEARRASTEAASLASRAREVNGVKILAARVSGLASDTMRQMADRLRGELGQAALVLASVTGERIQFVAAATPEAVTKGLHMGKLVGEVARAAGGGGGGRPDMAEAGGKDPGKVAQAIDLAWQLLEEGLRADD